MNVFLTGASTTLGTAMTESFFSHNATVFTCNSLPEMSEDIPVLLEKTTHGQPIDIIILLQANELTQAKGKITDDHTARLFRFHGEICRYFSQAQRKPKVVLSSSSTAIYSQETVPPVVETSSIGTDSTSSFFKRVEQEIDLLRNRGIRVIHLRLGTVISPQIPPRLEVLPLTGRILRTLNDSKAVTNWVSRKDAVRACNFLLAHNELDGPINIISGDKLTRSAFLREIANHFGLRLSFPFPFRPDFLLRRSANFAVPFLECGAVPMKLMKAGFFFKDISLGEYLEKDQPLIA